MYSRAVVNAGPLVALSLAGRLGLLPALFREVWIPRAVYREVAVDGLGRAGAAAHADTAWLARVVDAPEPDPLLVAELDRGEAEVIALANSSRPCLAIIDEKRGRRIAAGVYGLPIKGTAGHLVEARRRGLLDDLRGTASIPQLRQDPAAVLAAAGGAAVAILIHDEPTAYLVPGETYEWLLGQIEDAELAETVRQRQSQLGEAVEIDLNQL